MVQTEIHNHILSKRAKKHVGYTILTSLDVNEFCTK